MSADEDQHKVIQFPTAKQDEASAGAAGEFFSIDRRTFAEATKLGLPPTKITISLPSEGESTIVLCFQ